MVDRLKARLRRALHSDAWVTLAPTLGLVLAAFGVALFFVKPAPPKHIVLASAPEEGGSRYWARRYQELLKADGVTIEIKETTGSIANLAALEDDDDDAEVALVLSGTDGGDKAQDVVSLGSLSYVPVWVFYRGEPIDDLRALKGRRVAVGAPDSGTRALALTLLKSTGAEAGTTLLPLEREAAIDQLKKSQIDAAFFVSPAEAPAMKKLAAEPGVRLLSMTRADAFMRRFPYLTKVTLPRGVFDLQADVPDQDVVLLAPTANLLARDSLHPALAYLLMRAASQVHGRAGLLDKANEFPAPRETGFPLAAEARRYYQAGPPFLQRYLPFWAANLVDRLWVILVPIIAVLIPLGKVVPAVYRWRVRSRVYKWYATLKEIELQMDETQSLDEMEAMLRRLDETEAAVNKIRTPLAFTDNLYSFREHVDLVRRRLARRIAFFRGTSNAAAGGA